MPNLSKLLASGAFSWICKGALPSFTNVNNAGIVTGTAPFRHGISGNFFVDEHNNEVMMNSNQYLDGENILEKAQQSGRKVCLITAKDKLRDLLGGNNLAASPGGISLSTEFLKDADTKHNGIEYEYIMQSLMKHDTAFKSSYLQNTFTIYSGEASVNVLKLGVKLLESGLSDFAYLSLSDYIQHKYGPHRMEALDFYQQLDEQIGYLMQLECTIGITADHGMNDKTEIIYLQQVLDKEFKHVFGDRIRVICPITDPYVVHHGSLGSFVYVYVNEEGFEELEVDAEFDEFKQSVMEFLESLQGVTEVYCRDSTYAVLQLPHERVGDFSVIADKHVALGKTPKDHQLEHIRESGLRTHGGRSEVDVPFIVSKPLNEKYAQSIYRKELRNFNIFEFTCNGTQ